MPASTIDGNDLLIVHAAAGDAIARLRRGDGPHLLECITYRMAGHYVGDAQHYRSKEEVAAMKERCPIERLKRHLIECGVAETELDAIGDDARQEVLQAVEQARVEPRPNPATVLDYVYSSPALAATSG
jgi:pyruvate dehydrogenase E1 component alpha subunit